MINLVRDDINTELLMSGTPLVQGAQFSKKQLLGSLKTHFFFFKQMAPSGTAVIQYTDSKFFFLRSRRASAAQFSICSITATQRFILRAEMIHSVPFFFRPPNGYYGTRHIADHPT